MLKTTTLLAAAMAVVALSPAIEAHAAARDAARHGRPAFDAGRDPAAPQKLAAASGPGWCYWHPYACGEEDAVFSSMED